MGLQVVGFEVLDSARGAGCSGFSNFATVLMYYAFLCALKILRRLNGGTYVTEGAGGGTPSSKAGFRPPGGAVLSSAPPALAPPRPRLLRKPGARSSPARLGLSTHASAHVSAARRGPRRTKPVPLGRAAARGTTAPESPPTTCGAGRKRSRGRGAERQALGWRTGWAEPGAAGAGWWPRRAGDMQRDSGQAAGQWLDLRPLPSVARAPLPGSVRGGGGRPRDGVGASRCSPAPRRGCECPGRCPGPDT